MPRVLAPGQKPDQENSASLSGAPRSRGGVRAGNARGARRQRKDKFHVPPEAIPKGWVIEWKRSSCLGRPEEADYYMELADAGWKFASPEMFPMLVPPEYDGKNIVRGGMVLMIRPEHMKKESLRMDREEAFNQVRDKLSEIGMTAEGELPRRVQGVNRSYDRSGRMIPDDNGEDSPDVAEAGYEGHDERSGGQ